MAGRMDALRGWSSARGRELKRASVRTWHWLDHGHPRLENGAAIMTIVSLPVLFITLYAGMVAASLLPSPIDTSATLEFEDTLAGQNCFTSEQALLELQRVPPHHAWFDVASRFEDPRDSSYGAWFLIGNGSSAERRVAVLNDGDYTYTIRSRATLTNGSSVVGHSPPGATLTVHAGDADRSLLLTSDCTTTGTYVISLCEAAECLGV